MFRSQPQSEFHAIVQLLVVCQLLKLLPAAYRSDNKGRRAGLWQLPLLWLRLHRRASCPLVGARLQEPLRAAEAQADHRAVLSPAPQDVLGRQGSP